jgi:HYR domain.
VSRIPDTDLFPYGTTAVTYTALDIYENNATCVINITVEGMFE